MYCKLDIQLVYHTDIMLTDGTDFTILVRVYILKMVRIHNSSKYIKKEGWVC